MVDANEWEPPTRREWEEMRDDIRNLENMRQEMVQLAAAYKGLHENVAGMRKSQELFADGQTQRDLTLIKERGQNRRALYVLAGILGTALFGALATIIVAALTGQGPAG